MHREATFVLRMSGWPMRDAGIHDGDEPIVDRSLEPAGGNVVIAVLDNELTASACLVTGYFFTVPVLSSAVSVSAMRSEAEGLIYTARLTLRAQTSHLCADTLRPTA
ncbi:LexA family protein [Sulfuriferula plumbiphila]|uniref:LexA family protein n=1 Tax=Sulfuriferula plumbiphila TaxID=171865 RepID=UPI001CB8B56E|nr:S24 family peptidase [Sulfuriferula plumbiphila]